MVVLRHRRLLKAGKQGLARLRRGPQQQDPRILPRNYGLRDQEYLQLKVLTRMLPAV